jgi:hypothetical protein
VRTQSIAVSPPPITTTFLPSAFSVPSSNSGHLVAEALAVRRGQVVERRTIPGSPDARPGISRAL